MASAVESDTVARRTSARLNRQAASSPMARPPTHRRVPKNNFISGNDQDVAATKAPTMTRDIVNKEAIEDAREEYYRQLHEWEDQEDKDEDCCGIRVVIARNVTPGMLKRIPKSWLHGLIVTLSPDGVLELEDVEVDEHNETKTEVTAMLSNYMAAFRDDLDVSVGTKRPGEYCGETLTPDCVLRAPHPATPTLSRPLVIVEIEVQHLGVEKIILKARTYLSELHVERVVFFKLFPARVSALQQRPPLLRKAALAVVFERTGIHEPGALAAIRVVVQVSFGTAPLDGSVVQHLRTVSSRTEPAGWIHPIAASPFEDIEMPITDVRRNFAAMPPLILAVDPNGVGLGPPIPFDLRQIFKVAAAASSRDYCLRCR